MYFPRVGPMLLLRTLIILAELTVSEACADGWHTFNTSNHCFKIVVQYLNWTDAKIHCTRYNTVLAEFPDFEEYKAFNGSFSSTVWLGGRVAEDESWVWVHGDKIDDVYTSQEVFQYYTKGKTGVLSILHVTQYSSGFSAYSRCIGLDSGKDVSKRRLTAIPCEREIPFLCQVTDFQDASTSRHFILTTPPLNVNTTDKEVIISIDPTMKRKFKGTFRKYKKREQKDVSANNTKMETSSLNVNSTVNMVTTVDSVKHVQTNRIDFTETRIPSLGVSDATTLDTNETGSANISDSTGVYSTAMSAQTASLTSEMFADGVTFRKTQTIHLSVSLITAMTEITATADIDTSTKGHDSTTYLAIKPECPPTDNIDINLTAMVALIAVINFFGVIISSQFCIPYFKTRRKKSAKHISHIYEYIDEDFYSQSKQTGRQTSIRNLNSSEYIEMTAPVQRGTLQISKTNSLQKHERSVHIYEPVQPRIKVPDETIAELTDATSHDPLLRFLAVGHSSDMYTLMTHSPCGKLAHANEEKDSLNAKQDTDRDARNNTISIEENLASVSDSEHTATMSKNDHVIIYM